MREWLSTLELYPNNVRTINDMRNELFLQGFGTTIARGHRHNGASTPRCSSESTAGGASADAQGEPNAAVSASLTEVSTKRR